MFVKISKYLTQFTEKKIYDTNRIQIKTIKCTPNPKSSYQNKQVGDIDVPQ
jgi:hypothetical protein